MSVQGKLLNLKEAIGADRIEIAVERDWWSVVAHWNPQREGEIEEVVVLGTGDSASNALHHAKIGVRRLLLTEAKP